MAAADLARGVSGRRRSRLRETVRDAHVLLAVSCNVTVSPWHPSFTLMHGHEMKAALLISPDAQRGKNA